MAAAAAGVLLCAPSAFATWSGDFNGDKRTDVMTYSGDGSILRVAASNRNGRLDMTKWGDLPDGTPWKMIVAGDFTGDGRDDVAAETLSGAWTVGSSNGHAFSLAGWGSLPAVGTFIAEMAGDFNGDGKDDILASALDTGNWYVLRSTGSAFVAELWAPWPTGFWRDQVVGDFNDDGKDDFAARTPDTGDWLVGLSNGTAFATTVWGNWAVADTWTDYNTGDFDKNGLTDVAGRDRTTGQWVVSLSTGSSFVTGPWAPTAAAIWVDVVSGDFSGDGRTDIAGRESATGKWRLLRSTGSSFALVSFGAWPRGISFSNVVSGNENRDRRADVIGQHSSGHWWAGISTGTKFDSTDRTERVRPNLTVSVRGASLRGVRLGLRVSERADVTVRLELSSATARRLGLKRLVGTGVEHFLRSGADPLTVHFTAAARRRLAGHDVGLTIRATAVDPAANSRTALRRITLHG